MPWKYGNPISEKRWGFVFGTGNTVNAKAGKVIEMDMNAAITHPLAPYIFVLGILFLVGLVTVYAVYISKKQENERLVRLKEMALRSGFSYSENININVDDVLTVGVKMGGKIWNVLTATRQGVVWRIFDYRFGIGKKIHLQTVFMAETGRKFPAFSLMRETFLKKFDKLTGNLNDLTFDKNPSFSKQYILNGEDENSIRNLFNPNILHYFETHPLNGTIYAHENKIVFYQQDKRLAPEEMMPILEEVTTVISLFLRGTWGTPSPRNDKAAQER